MMVMLRYICVNGIGLLRARACCPAFIPDQPIRRMSVRLTSARGRISIPGCNPAHHWHPGSTRLKGGQGGNMRCRSQGVAVAATMLGLLATSPSSWGAEDTIKESLSPEPGLFVRALGRARYQTLPERAAPG